MVLDDYAMTTMTTCLDQCTPVQFGYSISGMVYELNAKTSHISACACSAHSILAEADQLLIQIRRPCSDFMDMLRHPISCRIIIIIIKTRVLNAAVMFPQQKRQ